MNKPVDAGALQASAGDLSRAKRLKEATNATHDRLDKSIMAAKPFASKARYSLFVKVQHQFHREIDALYASPVLDNVLPDLVGRRRFHLIEQDLADLEVVSSLPDTLPIFTTGSSIDLPTALGWLYVAEGSNLGAAFLLKEAKKIDLSETFGARHLAAAPEGRGLHWKTFTAALDNIDIDESGEERVVAGAKAAFIRVHQSVKELFG